MEKKKGKLTGLILSGQRVLNHSVTDGLRALIPSNSPSNAERPRGQEAPSEEEHGNPIDPQIEDLDDADIVASEEEDSQQDQTTSKADFAKLSKSRTSTRRDTGKIKS